MTEAHDLLLRRTSVQYGGVVFTSLVTATESHDGVCVFEVMLPGRALTGPLHTHHNEDAFTLLLEGEVRVQVGDAVVSATPGRAVWMPKGTRHTFWNPVDQPARCLEIASPAGIERYYSDLAAALTQAEGAGAAIDDLAHRFGIEFHWDSLEALLTEHQLLLVGDSAARAP